jgi:two-component system, cell cycle response regulator DivK
MDSRRVLLVQPHADSREMYTEFLSHRGAHTVAVGDGNDALRAATDADVIVTDLLVPGIDGIELITRLRKDDRTKHTPIIVLTACAFQSDRIRAEHAGCDAFLSMPCLPGDLLHQIGLLLVRDMRPATVTLRGVEASVGSVFTTSRDRTEAGRQDITERLRTEL